MQSKTPSATPAGRSVDAQEAPAADVHRMESDGEAREQIGRDEREAGAADDSAA